MRRARRLPERLVRGTSLCVCLALILTSLAMTPLPLASGKGASPQGQGNQEPNGKARKVTAEPPHQGPPSGTLPNLDEIKQRRQPEPKAPSPIASTARSKRKPLESRRGRKVGDPLPRGRASGVSNPNPSGIVAVASTRSSRVWPSRGANVSLSNNLLAWNGDASILNLFSYPAFHSFNYSALNYLRYASLELYQALSDSPFTLSVSSVRDPSFESAFNLPLTLMPEGNGYTYSRSITFDHTKVPNTDQSNFPVLISGVYSYLKTVANGGYVQNSNGYDVIFTSDSGCATKLNHEVETYDATTGAVNYWVKVPTVSHTTDTVIYLCYGNASIITDQSNRTAVWDSNFISVYHLPNGPSLNASDSTANANHGVNSGATATTGQIDGGGSFDASSKAIKINQPSGFNFGNGDYTFEAWVKPANATASQTIIGKDDNATGGRQWNFSLNSNGSGTLNFVHFNGNSLFYWRRTPISSVSLNVWNHVVAERNGAGLVMYINGASQALTDPISTASLGTMQASGLDAYIGKRTYAGYLDYFNGNVDEVRISNVARSADWVATEYNNQSSPATFYAISAASGNQNPVANAGGPYSGLSQTSIQFNGVGSSDPDGTIASYQWDFGDGATVSAVTPTHSYSMPGTYPVTLTVTDNSGATSSATATTTVNNRAPSANAGGPYSGTTGSAVSFNGAGSSDADGAIASYAWNFGDGGTGSGAAPTHTYSTPGSKNVSVTVTDNLGAQASALTTAGISAPSSDQFVQNFYLWGLVRAPQGDEPSYWSDIIRAAYPQGQSSMLLAMREFGKTVFESAEYAGRNRSDHDYVYDLYKTYLMREPDQQGWDNWTAAVPLYGREQVRRGFDESTEFINVVSTLSVSGSPSSNVSSLMTARVDPFNQPRSGLRARDAEWSMPLVSLPGRAGLDLGLSLSYSSMVWTRSGPYIYFDEDNGFPSPGFRLGFPTIEEKFFDARVARNVYVLLTGSNRVELRQVGSSNIYEAADSSYLQLTEGSSLLLKTTDGTQLTYWWFNHEFRCVEIKDRNGNYLTASYDWRGDIQNITDTLGRVITFNYDGNANLSTITQSWNGQTHTWATFGWSTHTMQPGLSGMVGTYNGEAIPVLTQVGLDDGSRYNFEYTGTGQVNVIRRYRSDNVQSSYTAYDYQPSTDGCPRISQTRVWAENWTGLNGVPAEVVTQFSDPGDGSHVVTAPDGTVYKEFYGSGWQKGLTTQSEVWSGGVRQKWTTTSWTQDNTGVSYQTNPRVTETNIYDLSGNRRRTTISYDHLNYAQYGLPYLVREYAADGTTEIRQTFTDYNLGQAYLDRRIIGLVSEVHVTNVANWQTKISYGYDDPTKLQSPATTATQHDQSFDASFLVRGNVTSVSRWDVTDITNAVKALTTQVGYDAAGSVLTTADPLGHQSSIGYADSFSDGNNGRNTFAYPTTVTDADGFSSHLQYNYDFGARTRAQGPPPAGQTQGAIQTISYDSAARIQQVTTMNTGAYQRYIYGPNYVQSFGSVNTVADDAYAIQVFDGAGRVIGAANYHPGSTGGFSMVNTIYDLMGRAVRQSNPGEINGSWVPVGDDAIGLLYTQQTYDWKGRPLVTTNTDGTQKYASYGGCGCAGGEVVTLTDEVGRQQKAYSDVLGRAWKTEVLNDDDSVYSTIAKTFNARDQVTRVRQYQGPDTSGVYQETAMTYDGYGRLQTRHAPEQDAGTSTVYAYNPDGTTYSVTDARGASATYSYNNNRRLVTHITYEPAGGIPDTPDVSFEYDSAGNRTSMTDGLGASTYNYNQLSRITSETRTLSGAGTYTLSYDYNLVGELTRITDPTNSTINYGFDSIGRLNSVTGSDNLYGGVSNYASGFSYRGSGAVKGLNYGNGLTLSELYNSRQHATQLEIGGRNPQYGPPTATKTEFSYYADGSLLYAHDAIDERFDRAFAIDHVGMVKEAYSGSEARDFINNTNSGTVTGPYRQSYQHDAFGNLTRRDNRFWSGNDTFIASYTNNRRQDPGFEYDADGNLTHDTDLAYGFDAAGNNVSVFSAMSNQRTVSPSFDGDGRMVKRVETQWSTTTSVTYYVRSTVLGGRVITELGGLGQTLGQKQKGYVYASSELLATQESNVVLWQHQNPITGSHGESTAQGIYFPKAEFDPMGVEVGFEDPYQNLGGGPPPEQESPVLLVGFGIPDGRCNLDGIAIDCGWAMQLMSNGSAVQCPNNDCGPRVMNTYNQYGQFLGRVLSQPFQAFADGYSGFLPPGARYQGGGAWVIPSNRPSTPPSLKPGAPMPGAGAGNRNPFGGIGKDEGPGGSITGHLSATPQFLGSQRPPPPRELSVERIRSGIAQLLQNRNCRDFIDKLLNQAFKDTGNLPAGTPLDVFDMVKRQGGFVFGPYRYQNTMVNYGSGFVGALGLGNAQVQINNEMIIANEDLYFGAILHELIHVSGAYNNYDDRVLAEAVNILGLGAGELPDSEDTLGNSKYWNQALARACIPVVGNSRK